MFEVFNVRTGETIGYTDSALNAVIACDWQHDVKSVWADYLNADNESTGSCSHGFDFCFTCDGL